MTQEQLDILGKALGRIHETIEHGFVGVYILIGLLSMIIVWQRK